MTRNGVLGNARSGQDMHHAVPAHGSSGSRMGHRAHMWLTVKHIYSTIRRQLSSLMCETGSLRCGTESTFGTRGSRDHSAQLPVLHQAHAPAHAATVNSRTTCILFPLGHPPCLLGTWAAKVLGFSVHSVSPPAPRSSAGPGLHSTLYAYMYGIRTCT